MNINVTDDTFEQEVLKCDIPVLIDFWAEWCGPCKMLTPVIEELSREMQGKVKILKMNVDENPHIPSKFGIRSIPSLIIFKAGEPVASKVGALPKASLQEWIEPFLD